MQRSDYVDGKGFVVNANPTANALETVCYTDGGGEVHLLGCATGKRLRVEGQVRRYTDFARWCRGFAPTRVETSAKAVMDCLGQALGIAEWSECGGEYTTNGQTFLPRIVVPVRRLGPDDRPIWARFVAKYSHEPMVNGRPGSQAAVRDFEFMCMGLPVSYYVTLEGDEITGFLTVNCLTGACDEIASLFVPPARRRRGYASSLLSVATQDILAAGRLPAYHAGGSPGEAPDLFGMLTGVGYHLVSVTWQA